MLRVALALSFLMGAAFLVNTYVDFQYLHFGWNTNAYGSIYYVTVGLARDARARRPADQRRGAVQGLAWTHRPRAPHERRGVLAVLALRRRRLDPRLLVALHLGAHPMSLDVRDRRAIHGPDRLGGRRGPVARMDGTSGLLRRLRRRSRPGPHRPVECLHATGSPSGRCTSARPSARSSASRRSQPPSSSTVNGTDPAKAACPRSTASSVCSASGPQCSTSS